MARHDDVAIRIVSADSAGDYVIQFAVIRSHMSETIKARLILTREKSGKIIAIGEEVDCVNIHEIGRIRLWNYARYLEGQKDSNQVTIS